MSREDYLEIMLAKLIDALLRQGTEQDGNWGYPGFKDELEEMRKSLADAEGLKKATKTIFLP